MFPSDIAHEVATHLDRPWQEVAEARKAELAQLHAAIAEAELRPAARERLIDEAVRRMHSRAEKDTDRGLYARLIAVLAARAEGALERVRQELAEARKKLGDCDGYLAVAPGWAQGCEMEVRMKEQLALSATIALGDPSDVAAATAIVTADVEHAALCAQVAAYARAATHRTQSVAHTLAHRHEASHLALRLVELASA